MIKWIKTKKLEAILSKIKDFLKNNKNSGNNAENTGNENTTGDARQKEENLDPNELFNSGKVKLDEKGDFQGAIYDFNKSLEIQEAHHVRADLGRAKEGNGDLEGALADYTKAIELEKRGLYYQWRSNLYAKMGREAEAKQDMEEYERLPKE